MGRFIALRRGFSLCFGQQLSRLRRLFLVEVGLDPNDFPVDPTLLDLVMLVDMLLDQVLD